MMDGLPIITQSSTTLDADVLPVGGGKIKLFFHEREIVFTLSESSGRSRLALVFEWVPDRSALRSVSPDRLNYRLRDFDYAVQVANGNAAKSEDGVGNYVGSSRCLAIDHGAGVTGPTIRLMQRNPWKVERTCDSKRVYPADVACCRSITFHWPGGFRRHGGSWFPEIEHRRQSL